MSTLLTLDPGTAHPAMAAFVDGRLHGVVAGEFTTREPDAVAGLIWDAGRLLLPKSRRSDENLGLACEWPMPYPGKAAMAKDVERLQQVVEGVEERAAVTRYGRYTPQQWKGGVSKAVHHERLLRFLTRTRCTTTLWRTITSAGGVEKWWKAIGPDARDAVGVGLFHLKVTGRGGVAP